MRAIRRVSSARSAADRLGPGARIFADLIAPRRFSASLRRAMPMPGLKVVQKPKRVQFRRSFRCLPVRRSFQCSVVNQSVVLKPKRVLNDRVVTYGLAFFVVAGNDDGKARRYRASFRRAYGIHGDAVPLLRLDLSVEAEPLTLEMS